MSECNSQYKINNIDQYWWSCKLNGYDYLMLGQYVFYITWKLIYIYNIQVPHTTKKQTKKIGGMTTGIFWMKQVTVDMTEDR